VIHRVGRSVKTRRARGHHTPRVLAGVGGALLVLFLAFLLYDNYKARARRERQAVEISAGHNHYVASQLSYFFSERTYDLRTLAGSREVASYLENRALGMSLQYGLRLSLADIAASLDQILKEKSFNGRPIYAWIAFTDESGAPLVERFGPQADEEDSPSSDIEYPDDVDRSKAFVAHSASQGVIVIAPVMFKGNVSGQITAEVDSTCLLSLVRKGAEDGTAFRAILHQQDCIVSNDTVDGTGKVKTLLRLSPGLSESHASRQAIVDKQLVVDAPIEGTPFSVIQSQRMSDVVAGARPWQVLLGMAALAVMILTLSVIIFRTTARNLVLRTRIDEQRLQQEALEQKNVDLAREIGIRRAMEKDLRRAKDAAETANRAKSEFLANMSHEIRTPLNAVIGLTDLTLTSELKDEQRSNLQIVVNSGQSLLNLLNDILDFSKIEAGKMNLTNSEFGIRSLVDITAETFRASVRGKDLEIVTVIPEELDDIWYGDVGRIRQILVNLVGNAVKFTARGRVEIAVERWCPEEGKETLLFKVTDTGIGIPSEKLATIFNAFEQADGSTTRRYGGTGLGLSIARKLANLMNGEIEVTSELGHGSCFSFRLEDAHTAEEAAA
jgi:two-component system, sensor histidine kinase and response regulator